MPQIRIGDLEPEVVEKLELRARRSGRSLAAEVRAILREAAMNYSDDTRAQVERIRAQFEGRQFGDSAVLVREDRDR